jgi:hypothetical protein
MPELRCPMCSKINEAEAEDCVFCGARLKPLVLDPASDAAPEDASQTIPGEGEETEEGAPDAIDRLRSHIGSAGEPETGDTDEKGEPPDWLDTLRPPGRRRKTADGEAVVEPEKPRGTDWLQRLRKIESSAGAAEDREEAEDGIELARAEIPDWLHVVREGADEEEIEGAQVEEGLGLGEGPAVHAPESPAVPDEALPASLEEEIDEMEEPEVEAPIPPSLGLDEEELEEEAPEEIDLESLREPEATTYARTPEPTDEERVEEKQRIARAVLPSWLEALRPIHALRTLEEEEDEQGQPVETMGPLAGLSDVLIAEPVVATPRTPGVVSPVISTTQEENEQARILRQLVEMERRVIEPIRKRKLAAPILRWVIGLFLVAAVAIPSFQSDAIFPSPRWVPQDLATMRTLVEDLPYDRPALVVADYDPGYSAELEAVGSSLLDHLLQRGMPVVTLSTRASGPVLAQRLIDQVSEWQNVVPGDDYLHLGYLSGGPTAIQLFASDPRYGGLTGFMLPMEREWSALWDAPILSGIESLDEFGAIVVITAGTESARTWAEQAAPQAGDTAFIMVLSAGAEPLMRPYFANSDRQVDAIYTGLPSATANEQLNGRSGGASRLWDAFGTGGWAAIVVLAVGGIVGAITSLLRRGAKEEADA